MPQGIKYSLTNPSQGFKKGLVGIGVSGSLGPTASTGLYSNVLSNSTSTYVITKVIDTNTPPIFFAPPDDATLIRLANLEGAGGVTTLNNALAWFAGQNGYIINANTDFPNIVVNGLTAYLDATLPGSYPNGGTNWYDLSGNGNNGGLVFGSPTFSTFDSKRSIRFSNQNKVVYQDNHDGFQLTTNPGISASGTSFTFEAWFYQVTAQQGGTVILSNAGSCDGYRWGPNGTYAYWLLGNLDCSQYSEGGVNNSTTMIDRWVQMVGIFDRANTLGGGAKFYHYINGTLEGSVGTYTPTIQLSQPGISYCCGAFDGYLSVVRVYNRALTQTEITQNFNAQKSYFGL
jgi:hypothetical protein